MNDMLTTFGQFLVTLGKRHPEILVLDADLNSSTKTNLFMEEFPDRFIQLGIAEQNMIGVAAGLSLAERYITFPTTFATFASKRVCDQISVSVAYQGANVKIIGAYAGISISKGGATHQSIEDLAIMRAIPGINIAEPGWPAEVEEVLEAAVAHTGPVYIRLSAGSFPDLSFESGFEWGKGRVFEEGKDCTIITTGIMIHQSLAAMKQLREEGIAAGLVHLSSIEPFDQELVNHVANESSSVITVENHGINGGLGDAVSRVVCESRPIPMVRIGLNRSFGQTARSTEDLFRKHHMTAIDIVEAARFLTKKNRGNLNAEI